MRIDIDTSEVRRLAVDLSKAPARVQRGAGQAIRKTAFDIERDAKILSPVDTGALKNSISTSISAGGLSAEIGPTVRYAHFVEEGTSRMSPQPYMRPAADRNTPGLERALGQAAERSVL